MANILPISQSDIAFDPETVSILSNAFDDAWERIKLSGSHFAKPAYANAMREVIAKHIIDRSGRRARSRQAQRKCHPVFGRKLPDVSLLIQSEMTGSIATKSIVNIKAVENLIRSTATFTVVKGNRCTHQGRRLSAIGGF